MASNDDTRDLRTRDFATPDAEPATLLASGDDTEPLPERRYTSILFWRLVRALDAERPPARILELGAATQSNIQFWGERGFKVTCYDLMHHETEHMSGEPITNLTLAPEKIRLRSLPFEDEAFTAICAWNVFACMPFVVARRYIRECYRVLSPTGIVHSIFLDADGRLDTRRNYRVADRQQLDVSRAAVQRRETDWVKAELAFMFSVFDACETKRGPCQTRELLAQRGPTGPVPFGENNR